MNKKDRLKHQLRQTDLGAKSPEVWQMFWSIIDALPDEPEIPFQTEFCKKHRTAHNGICPQCLAEVTKSSTFDNYLSTEDARKLRIMKAMEAAQECYPTAVFVRRNKIWGRILCDGSLAPVEFSEPLWEGEAWKSELGHIAGVHEHQNPKDWELAGWRKIKVREVK